jgi:cellulose synthase/poly-beta-1,6-N-acetylglucosamine synthase-like glycosyltransferase
MALWLFIAALLLLLHTYVGYPAWLWWRARGVTEVALPEAASAGAGGGEPAVVVVVAGHNEAARIAAKVQTCLAQDWPADKLRVLVACDGCTDNTADLARAAGGARVQLLAFEQRRGKAACLNDAVAACTEELVVFTDARQRLHPQAVRRLVARLREPGLAAVSGELQFVDDSGLPFERGMGAYWRYEKFIRDNEARTGTAIGVTGALYAMRRACFQPIPAATVLDDVLIPMQAVLQGWRVGFERGALAYDKPSAQPAQERLRKVRTLAGNFQILALCPALLLPWRNPAWGRYMAHKVLRLAGPLLLLVLLLANAALAAAHGGAWQALLLAQLLGYAAVAAAHGWPALQRLAPLRLAVTFIHLNWFVVLGLLSFLRNRQMQLWQKAPEAAP